MGKRLRNATVHIGDMLSRSGVTVDSYSIMSIYRFITTHCLSFVSASRRKLAVIDAGMPHADIYERVSSGLCLLLLNTELRGPLDSDRRWAVGFTVLRNLAFCDRIDDWPMKIDGHPQIKRLRQYHSCMLGFQRLRRPKLNRSFRQRFSTFRRLWYHPRRQPLQVINMTERTAELLREPSSRFPSLT